LVVNGTVRGQRVVVVGLGLSGLAAARRSLAEGAARVTINDRRGASEIDLARYADLTRRGVEFALGGHDDAVFAEADLIVLSPGVPPLESVARAKARGVMVIGEVELASWYSEAPVIAVTGTNGKSTVTTLLGEMMESSGFATFTGGNLGPPWCDAVGHEATAPGGRCVIEVSSYQLEATIAFKPFIAVWLNLTPDHLDRYGSMAAYGAAKARIFLAQRPEDHAVVPADDPVLLAFARAGAAKVHTWGGEHSPVRIVGDAIVGPGGLRVPVGEVGIKGAHNVGNAMAAALAAHLGGATVTAIARTLRSFTGLPHRMQRVVEHAGVVYVDDSKATNVGAALKALEGVDRPVVLIAGGRDKGGSYDPLVQLLRAKARAVVLLGEAAPLLARAMGSTVAHEVAADMDDAVRRAAALAQAGDCVLLAPACSSLDMYKSYAERGDAFALAARSLRGVEAP
jgi:UDP-N-acetylmuramoylalanine--D-glutamate ligase